MNSKGDINSEIVYFLAGAGLVVIGLALLFAMSNQDKKDNLNQVSDLKEGYQTIQLARTYLQTPLEFEGETKPVAMWANDYFQMSDYTKRNELRRAMYDLAQQSIKPNLRASIFDSEAAFTYYFLGKEQDKVVVASTWATSSKDLQVENVVYVDNSQSDVTIQIPVYMEDEQQDPSERYILFEIKTTDSKSGEHFPETI